MQYGFYIFEIPKTNQMSKEIFRIRRTNQSPEITFNKELGTLRITGNSIIFEDTTVFDRLLEYLDKQSGSAQQVHCILKLSRMNVQSQKYLFKVLKKIEQLSKEGQGTSIEWQLSEEDSDMAEIAEDFSEMISVPINTVHLN